MGKIDAQRPEREYPSYGLKRLQTYQERGRLRREVGDDERLVSYWYPMSGQFSSYDDDPDCWEDISSFYVNSKR